jgi:predicted phage terminase large subunit-like protein
MPNSAQRQEEILPPLPDNDFQQERSRRRLLNFVTYTMPGYQVNWHHKIICRELEALVRGENTRLILTMPPRHGKSELVSRRLPAWILGKDPDAEIIACSYSADLAARMNRDVQRIIDSEEYARIFPDTRLFGANVRTTAHGSYLRNSDIFEVVGHRGVYRSSGIGGGITGMGAKYAIIDDPCKNRQDANSATIRQTIWEWYTSTLYTRLSPDGRVLVILTRWHEDDIAGRLLEAAEDGEAWRVISFPAIAEPSRGDVHPEDKRGAGEGLWPGRFDIDRLGIIKKAIGSYEWTALYQQRPAPAGGYLFRKQHFRKFRQREEVFELLTESGTRRVEKSACQIFQTCDVAGSTKSSADYFVVGTFALTAQNELLVLDIFRTRIEGPDQPGHMRRLFQEWRPLIQGVESKNMGLALFQQLRRDGLPIIELKADADKVTRAIPAAARYEAGSVYHLENAMWLDELEKELTSFPNGAHDDQVDVVAYAVLVQLWGYLNIRTKPKNRAYVLG